MRTATCVCNSALRTWGAYKWIQLKHKSERREKKIILYFVLNRGLWWCAHSTDAVIGFHTVKNN